MTFYKKFLKFNYSAIKRYGEKYWTPFEGVIEFNVNYVVSCSVMENGNLDANQPELVPYMLELSNGTKLICVADMSMLKEGEVLLSEQGETAVEVGEHNVNRKFVNFLVTNLNY